MVQRYSRSLRFRFLAALGGVLLLALISLVVLSKWVIFPALHKEERAVVTQELKKIERTLQISQQNLLAQVRDWAIWDDTYEFVQGSYPGYTDTNFSQQMFEEMRYQLMAFFNAEGDVHFLAGINPATGQYHTCYSAERECRWMAGLIRTMQVSIKEDPKQGKSDLYAGSPPLMVASNPIFRTDESGPPQGWLFKVRPMDDAWLALIEDYTGLPTTLSMVDSSEDNDIAITISGNTIVALRYLATYPLNEQLALGTQLNRTSYLASLETFRYVLLWTACLMLLVIGLVLLLLERIILKPLKVLTRFTQQTSDDFEGGSQRLLQRGDEIGILARAFQKQLKRQQQLNAELIVLSTHDPLTNLPNRRLFDQRLKEVVSMALSTGQPLSVMMIDIDHFKLFNDHYGHPEGDVCLQRIAQTMHDVATVHGFFIARTGGEEFSAMLPATCAAQAMDKSQALSYAIDQLRHPHQTSPVASYVTVSIGISQLNIEGALTPSGLMSAADQALYAAKAAGRHCAKIYKPLLANSPFSSHNTTP
ncbi:MULTISPECIES: diguanylate cyclase [unclassified Halomonas]|uniref:sensor domain-containing diguanylate cyclase n=1 Tax=unclassified Halomonas TaxID=2609666 RepID=UPI0007D9F031|nr:MULTISPECIES: diguanylate cyclase [unclassified Halomonas]MBT2788114.1 diguanylate cyclase [Halomonas sp. ISL-106]MBT2795863.1 diguanylate cyclase [Halomonas sp. ISL-104]OAL61146.1 response regulator [Halomonas sp. ALS9]